LYGDFNTDFNADFKTSQNKSELSEKLINFMSKYTGLEHIAGVLKGGTFVLVYEETLDTNGAKVTNVLADFSLPYFIQSEKQPGDFNNDFNNSYRIEK